jgi:DNA-binding protein
VNEFDIEMDRALFNRYSLDLDYEHVYVDFDDTILIDNKKVNTPIISFLYQCLNDGKKLILITKHDKDIEKTLADIKIDKNMFSKIIHLKKTDKKVDHIKEKKAIFIDDSFSERLEVAEKHGIATFDHSALECLVDWKV